MGVGEACQPDMVLHNFGGEFGDGYNGVEVVGDHDPGEDVVDGDAAVEIGHMGAAPFSGEGVHGVYKGFCQPAGGGAVEGADGWIAGICFKGCAGIPFYKIFIGGFDGVGCLFAFGQGGIFGRLVQQIQFFFIGGQVIDKEADVVGLFGV